MDQNTNPEARNGDRKYRVRPGFVLREIAGEAAIIPVDGQGAFGNAIMAPNQTAAFLWKAFEQPRTIEEVVAAALEQFDAPPRHHPPGRGKICDGIFEPENF